MSTSPSPVEYVQGARLPQYALEWLDDDGGIIDFSSGWTFVATVAADTPAETVAHTQDTGITGDDVLPNVVIAWSSAFASLSAGWYWLRLVATGFGGATRVFQGRLRILPNRAG